MEASMMISRTLWLALISIALATLSAGVYAELYRWVDENGKVHYSDTPPPPNVKQSKELRAPPSRKTLPAAAEDGDEGEKPDSYAEKEAEFRKRQVEKAEKQAELDREKEQAKTRKLNCDTARSQLAGLKSGGRISRINAQGEREYLDERDIEESIVRAQKSVSEWCN